MDKASAKKKKRTDMRYSVTGIPPPGLNPIPNIRFMEEAATWIPESRGTTEATSDISKLPGVDRINNGKARYSITADEFFLRDIINEAKTDPLRQDPNHRTSAGGENITDHSFPSKVWASLKNSRNPLTSNDWPRPSGFKGLAGKPQLLDSMNLRPDQLIGYKSQNISGQIVPTSAMPTAPVNVWAHESPSLRSSVPGKSSQDLCLPINGPTGCRAWRPPPEFVPGVPFQNPAPTQNTALVQNPTHSGSFPPGIQIEGLHDFPSRYPMHGKTAETPQFRTEIRYPAFVNPQLQHHLSQSMRGLTFRPAETANAAIAQLHSSMSASQLRSIVIGNNQNLRYQFAANSGGYVPPGRRPNVNYFGNSFMNWGNPRYVDIHYDEQGTYLRKKIKYVKPNDTNSIPQSGNTKQLLNSTRGVYIRGVPPGATLRQICANIRGGAVDRIKLHANDSKIDAAVYFVLSDSARTYKHWSNRVGGIWWSPASHKGAFPSFTAFIGPENGGHDRLKDIVKDAIASEGATRCIHVVGLPGSLTEGKVTNDLKMGIYPDVVDIESFNITTHDSGGQGDTKRSANIKFASIETALSARNVFAKAPIYKGAKVYFTPDDCAGSMQELADRWNREIMDTLNKSRGHTA